MFELKRQSQLVRHLNDCSNCYPQWDECTILEVERVVYKHLVKETIHIIQSGIV